MKTKQADCRCDSQFKEVLVVRVVNRSKGWYERA